MFLKKGLAFCGICLLSCTFVLSQELTERSRLGPNIEGTTYISSGSLAGKVAFIDCWSVYVSDLTSGNYEKLFSVEKLNFNRWPTGIVYISQGAFARNFLLHADNIGFLVDSSGDLIGEVQTQGFQWGGEGMTEITSGLYKGKIALLGFSSSPGVWYRHICIFHMEYVDGIILAILDYDITGEISPYPDYYALGITFLPEDSPEYPNHFVIGEVPNSLGVFDEQGNRIETFTGIPSCEGLAYIPSGIHKGKLFITDMTASAAAIRNIDGSLQTPINIPIGPGLFGASATTWLSERQQLIVFGWSGYVWNYPTYLISRPRPGQWIKDAEFPCTQLKAPYNMTDMTSAGTYYLFGSVDSLPGILLYQVHVLDEDFNILQNMELPTEYLGLSFGRLVYIPGATSFDDHFLLTQAQMVYSFDSFFSYPADITDLSGKVTSLSRLCYDPGSMRYYALDVLPNPGAYSGTLLRVFDQNWNQLAEFDLSGLSFRGFNDITIFTSGDLKGNVALLGGLYKANNDLFIINFEYQIATDLIEALSHEVLASGIKVGLSKALNKELSNALMLVEKKQIDAAIYLLRAFQLTVAAQSGKGTPVDLAQSWLDKSAEIIRGLENLRN